jgi:RNA polymerase sigma factor (sigma-70 family)
VSGNTGELAEREARRREGAASLEELYERHVGRAVALARLLTGDPSVAEDVAHDAFLRVTGRFGHLREPAAFEGYLRRTVVNLCRMRLRRARLERMTPTAADQASPAGSGVEEREVVRSALLSLPQRQRTAIVLRFYEDLSERQTAELMRCSPRAVNALVSRAMVALRTALTEEER